MPQRGWLALLPIVVCVLSGCIWRETAESTSWLKRFNNQAISADHALIEVALIERPVGDDYINQHLWGHTDEIIGTLEQRGLLDENGFRLGQLVGLPPQEFHQLLLSKRCCSNPQSLIFPAGSRVPIYLDPIMRDHATYEVVLGKRRSRVAVDQARFCLEVQASFTLDGRTKLTFTPKVEHGETTLPFHAAPEQSEWVLNLEKASNKYPDLSWEVTLGTNQYLVVGGRMKRDHTLGRTSFTQQDATINIQRLLVIRNCRPVTTMEAHQNTVEDLIRADKSPPLALQATLPAVRAKGQ